MLQKLKLEIQVELLLPWTVSNIIVFTIHELTLFNPILVKFDTRV
jgi:hypothetical protein